MKDSSQSAEFLQALKALKAHGGGDCHELGFKGMIDAIDENPRPGSLMYVFTDAPPKDASEDNKDYLREAASALDIKINVFLRESCGTGFQAYKDIAEETGGSDYVLRSTADLEQLGKMVQPELEGMCSLQHKDWGWLNRVGRREIGNVKYSIPIDDSIERVFIQVTVQNFQNRISLNDPRGNTVSTGRVRLANGVVYNIERPITGNYELKIPTSAGKHKYKVDAVSEVNIDFGHYYVAIARRGSRIPTPLDQPLKGVFF